MVSPRNPQGIAVWQPTGMSEVALLIADTDNNRLLMLEGVAHAAPEFDYQAWRAMCRKALLSRNEAPSDCPVARPGCHGFPLSRRRPGPAGRLTG